MLIQAIPLMIVDAPPLPSIAERSRLAKGLRSHIPAYLQVQTRAKKQRKPKSLCNALAKPDPCRNRGIRRRIGCSLSPESGPAIIGTWRANKSH